MIIYNRKKINLLVTIIFAFAVLVPAGAVFADTEFDGTYKYVSTGKEVCAGSVEISEDSIAEDIYELVVQVNLPGGVEFENNIKSNSDLDNIIIYGSNDLDFNLLTSDSKYLEFEFTEFNGGLIENSAFGKGTESIKVSFGKKESRLNIDDNFSGNLDLDISVLEINSNKDIAASEDDSITIAKVTTGEVEVTAADPKKLSMGRNKEAAKIIVEESKDGDLSDEEELHLKIDTSGVTFNDIDINSSRIGLVKDGGDIKINYNNDKDEAWITVENPSSVLSGKIELVPYLNIDPDVSSNIEITVYSDPEEDVENETFTVATVGESELIITTDSGTGMEEYMKKTTIDELWEMTLESNKDFEEGDKIYISLPDGFKFYEKAVETYEISENYYYKGLYDDEQSMWLEVNKEGAGKNKIKLVNLFVSALPDSNYGDINVKISGDLGEAKVKAGVLVSGSKIELERKQVVAPGYNQKAGNITFVEKYKDSWKNGLKIHLALPNNVEFSTTPKVTINGKEIDGAKVGPGSYDNNVLRVTIDESRKTMFDTLVISDIRYDITTWLTEGNLIKVNLGGNDPKADDNLNAFYEMFASFYAKGLYGKESFQSSWDKYQFKGNADDVVAQLSNAIIVNKNYVIASFTHGEEGVALRNGRTLVQVNQLCDVLRLQKSWDAESNTAYFVKNGIVIAFPVNKDAIIINGSELAVDQGGIIIDGYAYATLRGIKMAFGGELNWDNEKKTATFRFEKKNS